MKRLYGLRNDKENISLIIGDDKAMLIIQTSESFEVRDLNLEFDLENENEISADKVKPINIDVSAITTDDIAKTSRCALKGIANNVNVDNKVKITEGGVETSSANKEKQPEPIQRALKRIEELKYITDVRIDEEFETTVVDDFPKNRLTITIDYLDVDFVKEMKKGD